MGYAVTVFLGQYIGLFFVFDPIKNREEARPIGLFFYYTKRGQCIGLGGGHHIALRFLYIMAP